jgi:oligoendopeptidase F
LELVDFQNPPSEVAELASMTMELITMDHWGLYFSDPEEMKRAQRQHLEQVLETLPWVAAIDKFQHWIYENPHHRPKDRLKKWVEIYSAFTDRITDWTGLEHYREHLWQRQLHLFEVPFYYIEYGFAQLGAIAIWKNYRENPEKALKCYLEALRLGYQSPIPEIYRAAGIEFSFNKDYIKSLMEFVGKELAALR